MIRSVPCFRELDIEAAGVIGAERYERTVECVTGRNRPRPKLLATKARESSWELPS